MKLVIPRRNLVEIILIFLLIIIMLFNSYKYATRLVDVIIILSILFLLMMVRKSVVINALPFLASGCIWCITFLSGIIVARSDSYLGEGTQVIYVSILILFTCLFMGMNLEKREIRIILSIYVFCNILVSLNILINYFSGNFYVDQRASLIVNGVYKDPNYVASLIVPAVFLAFLEWRNSKRFLYKLFVLSSLGIMAFAILITGSRAALVGVFVSIAVYVVMQLFSYSTKSIYKAGIVLLLVIVILFGSYLLMISEGNRFTNISGYTSDIRVVIWTDAFSFWKRAPLIGNGVNATSNYTLTCWYGRATHNCFLDLLGDSGVIGLACFARIIWLLFKKIRDKRIAIAFTMIALVPQAFINGFYGFNFWFLLCLIKLMVDYLADDTASRIQRSFEIEGM